MSRTRRSQAALVAAALVLGACAEGANSPVAPTLSPRVNAVVSGLASSAPSRSVVGGPDLSDFLSFQGEVWICKDGNVAGVAFDFDYTVIRQSDNAVVAQGSTTVPVGQCRLATSINTQVSGRYRATATETSVVPSWSLMAIDWAYGANLPASPPAPTIDLANRTVSAVLIANDVGVQLTFTNQFVAPPAGQIGDFVWEDLNGNGIQDSGEPGLPGVTVTLGGAASASATTDSNGGYLFGGLSAGAYTVTVATPIGYSPTVSGAGSDPAMDSNGSLANVSLATNSSIDHTIDFGYVAPRGEIGDFVWNDLNGNGIQDSGEPGLAGVSVILGGASSASVTTDGNGAYSFGGLSAGNYTVTVVTPSGFSPTVSGAGSDPAMDSNGSVANVSLATNSSINRTIDFGYIKPLGQIGDYVWYDKDRDGIQDSKEYGLGGVTVTLAGPVNATTTTASNGSYLFTGLPAGTYTVSVATPNSYVASPTLRGSDRGKDSNTNPTTVVLATNSSIDRSIDFGFDKLTIVPCVQPTTWWTSNYQAWNSKSDGKPITKYDMFYSSGKNNWTMITMSTKNGNAYVILAQELITATLVKGYYETSGIAAVDAAMAGAEAYFAAQGNGIQTPTGATKAQLLAWANTLDAWTDGRMGTRLCGGKC